MTRYWKVTDEQGRACHGGEFQYSLPRWSATRGWIPGKWTPLIEPVTPCETGYHVCKDEQLLQWLGPRIYACEVRGTVVDHSDKIVAGSIRLTCPTPWDDVSARLFAVECASETLSLYESQYPSDARPSDALQTAFHLALGEATSNDLAAASAAAWAASASAWAASDAASAAAWAASDAASAASDAASAAAWAASDAARAAAWAASDAARAASAASGAARAAQTRRLLWWLGVDDAHGGA